MPYSAVSDLLVGDLLISNKVDKAKFVTDAADEIDSKLGFRYKIPLTPIPPATVLPIHQILLLKGINNKLASGRLILTLDITAEDRSLHAYGLRLVTEAMNDLMLIANGDIDLTVDPLLPANEDDSKVPAIKNFDAESGVDAFYNQVMREEPWYWMPGAAR